MKTNLLVLLVIVMSNLVSKSQNRTCLSHEWHQQQLMQNPEYASNRTAIEAHTEKYIKSPKKQRGVKTIPVVVHVVYNAAAHNISDAQILSQLDILNKDFRRLNSDALNTPEAFQSMAADCEIQFCLAQKDPNGNPTSGIVRKFTTAIGFVGNDAVKFAETGGDPAWDRNKYLNIWVCNLTDALGYSTFPGAYPQLDGVVIRHSAFGTGGTTLYPYNLGRTATHEVGHWLNLLHIWGDDGTGCNGTDQVDDTPNQAGYNVSCPVFPRVSCSNGPNGDMFMNYMDYTNDACMNMFTQGQKQRIDAMFAFGGPRFALLSSNACNNNPCGIVSGVFSTNITWNSAQVGWTSVPAATNYILQLKAANDTHWTTINTADTGYTFSGLNPATSYNFKVMTQCDNGYSDFSNSYTLTTSTEPTPCNTPDSINAYAVTYNTASISWQYQANATAYIVRYKAVVNMNWISDTITSNQKIVSDLIPTTTYDYQVQTICANGISNWSALQEFTTPAIPISCTNSFEPNNNRNAATPLATNTTIASMIGAANDKDYYVFSTTSAQPKIKITLTNLPKNYNLSLLSAYGKELVKSNNSGTLSEEIRYNASSTGNTYYVYVYPSGKSDYSIASCYNLSINTNADYYRIDVPYPNNNSEDNRIDMTISENRVVYFTGVANEPITLAVYAITGQRVFQTHFNAEFDGENTYQLSNTNLNSGLYVVEILTASEKQTSKFIIH